MIIIHAGLSSCNQRNEEIITDKRQEENSKTLQLSPQERENHVLITMLGEYQRLMSGSDRDQERAALLKPRLIEGRQKIKQRSEQDANTKSLLLKLDALDRGSG